MRPLRMAPSLLTGGSLSLSQSSCTSTGGKASNRWQSFAGPVGSRCDATMHGIGASLSGFGAAIDETRAKRGAIVFALGVLAIGAIAIPWLTALLARRPSKVAAIALANKMARMVWAMMARGERYKEPAALAA